MLLPFVWPKTSWTSSIRSFFPRITIVTASAFFVLPFISSITELNTAELIRPTAKAPKADEIPIAKLQNTKPKSRGSLVLVRMRQIDNAPNAPSENSGLF